MEYAQNRHYRIIELVEEDMLANQSATDSFPNVRTSFPEFRLDDQFLKNTIKLPLIFLSLIITPLLFRIAQDRSELRPGSR